jgi:hypothetical protein
VKLKAASSPALTNALDAAKARGDVARREGLEAIGEAFVDAFRSRIGGQLAKTAAFEVSGSHVDAGSPSPLAAILERGRKPGRRPPPAALAKSMGVSHAVAERRADAIAAKGTRGRRYVEKSANDVNRNDLPRIARETAERLAALK